MSGFAPPIKEVRPTRLVPPPDVSAEALQSALATPGRLTPDGERCPTCHTTIRDRYCAVCGEKRPSAHPSTVLGFLRAAVARVFDADNRLYRSLWTLIARPGALTTVYLKGRHQPYLGPLQLFVLVNSAFYLFVTSGIGPNTFQTPLHIHVSSDNFYHEGTAQRWVNNEIDAPEGWSYEAARAAEDSLDRVSADSPAHAQLPPRVSQSALRAFQSYADRFDRQAEWLSKNPYERKSQAHRSGVRPQS